MTKIDLNNPLFQPSFKCRKIEQDHFSVEVSGCLLLTSWDAFLNSLYNPAEEDLYLQVYRDDDQLILEKKVTHLSSTEEYIEQGGRLKVRLVKKSKFRFSISSPFHYTPKIIFISENEGRHHLVWEDVDWQSLKKEVEISTGLDWEKDVELVLHVIRMKVQGDLPKEEWQPVGLANSALLLGILDSAELVVIEKGSGKEKYTKPLKRVFELRFHHPTFLGAIGEAEVEASPLGPYMELKREIWEEDSVQIRAWWRLFEDHWNFVEKNLLQPEGLAWADVDVCVRLFKKGVKGWEPFRKEEQNRVLTATDYLFTSIPAYSTFKGALVLHDRREQVDLTRPLLVSAPLAIPDRPDKIVLMPIDENRIFAYWHLDMAKLSKKLEEFSGGDQSKVKTYLRVFHDWAGGLHHHMDKDAEISLEYTDNYYLNVEPDKIYRVQLAAVHDDGRVEPLTDFSNPVQTARVQAGNNPVEFREVAHSFEHPSHKKLESPMDTADYSIGLLTIHLHAHLPFIRRRVVYGTTGIWQPIGFPEEWYHEAVRETYVPLLMVFERLREEGVDFRISMDISPTLSNMMRCPLLQEEFLKYMEANISIALSEVERTRREAPHYHQTAWMHLNRFREVRDYFLSCGKDLTVPFKKLQEQGYLEISTCGATHAFLPFFTATPAGIRAQIQTAVEDYKRTFDCNPVGIWLPECAYVPGIEGFVQDAGLRYFFTETHAVLLADAPAAFGTHAPVYIKGSDVAAFARDPETGKQVWSGEEGYPGDPDYLEFHIKGGPLKYNRITSRGSDYKEPYVREWALEKAARHAQHFMEARNFRFEHIKNWFWKKPLVVAMYDAELFGHHWYEGPDFLYFLFKKLHYNQNQTELITPSAYLKRYPRNQEVFLNPSSWGDKGTFDKWMYGSVSWMYRHSHEAIEEMTAMMEDFRKHRHSDELCARIVKQAIREVLQSMNSDIPFVISNGHFVDRMKEFFFDDLERFWKLASLYWNDDLDPDLRSCLLRRLEMENPIFPDIPL